MTKANELRKFFAKFFNISADGNSTVAVLNSVVKNNDVLPGCGSKIVEVINSGNELRASYNEIKSAILAGQAVYAKQVYSDDMMSIAQIYFIEEDTDSNPAQYSVVATVGNWGASDPDEHLTKN